MKVTRLAGDRAVMASGPAGENGDRDRSLVSKESLNRSGSLQRSTSTFSNRASLRRETMDRQFEIPIEQVEE